MITYNNRSALSQDLMLHDTISRKAGVFLQLSSGLSTNGVLDMLKLFPDLFTKYFIHEEVVTAEMLLSNIELPTNPTGPEEERTFEMFKKYIGSCSSKGRFYNISI